MIQAEFPSKVSAPSRQILLSCVATRFSLIADLIRRPMPSTQLSGSQLSFGPSVASPTPLPSAQPAGAFRFGADSPLLSVSVATPTQQPLQLVMGSNIVGSSSVVGGGTQTRKAERVQQWLLSCVHRLLPMLVAAFDVAHTVCSYGKRNIAENFTG